MLISGLKNVVKKLNTVLRAVPGLKKLRGFGRITGIVGMIMQLSMSLVDSVASLDPIIFFRTLALNLVQINQGLIADVNALQSGVSGTMFLWRTWGVYSKLWFIVFVTGLIAGYMKKVHFGDQVPKYQIYLVTFVVVLTPLQVLGSVIVEVVSTGSLKRGQLWEVVNFWEGIRMVFANTDLWVKPVVDVAAGLPGIDVSDKGLNSTEQLNSTVRNIQRLDKGG